MKSFITTGGLFNNKLKISQLEDKLTSCVATLSPVTAALNNDDKHLSFNQTQENVTFHVEEIYSSIHQNDQKLPFGVE